MRRIRGAAGKAAPMFVDESAGPSFKMTLAGTACDYTAEYCVNAATDPNIQQNLQAQIGKYKKDVDPFKVFPILSFGVAYNFNIKTR